MLEVHEAAGAFERIETWLRGKGFFAPGGESLVADLYLGYGLSATIRRTAARRRPSPVRFRSPRAPSDRRSMMSRMATTSDEPGDRALARGRGPGPTTPRPSTPSATAIARGDVYQVNLVQHLSAAFSGSAARARRPARRL